MLDLFPNGGLWIGVEVRKASGVRRVRLLALFGVHGEKLAGHCLRIPGGACVSSVSEGKTMPEAISSDGLFVDCLFVVF